MDIFNTPYLYAKKYVATTLLDSDIFVMCRYDGDRDDKRQNYIISAPDLIAAIAAAIPGAGVTSVTLNNLNPLFTVSNTGTVTDPIFTFVAPSQAANLFYAGPTIGVPAIPTFRALTLADLPALPGSTLALCQLDFYVTNINSCSPLHINPTNGQDVYIGEAGGNVGIGTATPLGKLGVVGITGGGEKLISLYSSDWATPGEEERFYLTQGAFYARANTYDLHAAGGGDATFTIYGNANGTIKIWSDAAGSDTFSVIGGNMPTISSLASGLMFTDASWTFGNSVTPPTAKVHIIGATSDNTTYALKVENNSVSPILSVRNDGLIGIGTNSPTEKLTIANGNIIGSNAGGFMILSDNANNFISLNDSGVGRTKVEGFLDVVIQNVWSFNTAIKPSIISLEKIDGGAGAIAGVINIKVDRSGISGSAIKLGSADGTPQRSIFIDVDNNFSGFNYNTPSAVVHIKGKTILAADTAFAIINNAITSLFSIQNSGLIKAPGLQVGNAGLASGDLYVDTAANILANGDLVVGRKV